MKLQLPRSCRHHVSESCKIIWGSGVLEYAIVWHGIQQLPVIVSAFQFYIFNVHSTGIPTPWGSSWWSIPTRYCVSCISKFSEYYKYQLPTQVGSNQLLVSYLYFIVPVYPRDSGCSASIKRCNYIPLGDRRMGLLQVTPSHTKQWSSDLPVLI